MLMTVAEGQRLAALLAFFVHNGYKLPSGVRSSDGSYRFTDYGSNSEEVYAQEQQSSKIIRGTVSQPRFSINYGSESQVIEVQISSNQVQKIVDKVNNKEYFPRVSGSQLTIDSETFYKG